MSSASLRSSSITPILALLALLLCNSHLSSQPNWERANTGLWGGELHVIAFAADGEPIAAVGRYLYRGEGFNDDNPSDVEWRRVLDIWDARQIERAGDGTLYAASPFIIVRSVDDGRSWEHVSNREATDIAAIDRNRFLFVDRHDRLVYEVTSDHEIPSDGIIRTDSVRLSPTTEWIETGGSGQVWKRRSGSITIDYLMRYDPDSGRFVRLPTPSFPGNRTARDLLFLRDSIALALCDDGVKRSTDGGATWRRASGKRLDTFVPGGGASIFAYGPGITASDLYRSDDTGISWSRCDLDTRDILAVGRNGALVRGFERRIETSTSCNAGWVSASTGLESAFIGQILEGPNGTLWATSVRRQQNFDQFWSSQHDLYRSDDRGDSWTLVRDSVSKVAGIDSAGRVYVLIDSVNTESSRPYGLIYRTDDLGSTWHRFLSGKTTYSYYFGPSPEPAPINPAGVRSFDSNLVRIGLAGGIAQYPDCFAIISSDGGETYDCEDQLYTGLFDTTRLKPVTSVFLKGDLRGAIYVVAAVRVGDPGHEVTVGFRGFLFDPIERTLVETGRPDPYGVKIVGTGSTLIGTVLTGHRIVVSTDTGRTWTERTLPEDTRRWWYTGADVKEDGTIIYTGVRDENLWLNRERLRYDEMLVSTDHGATWSSLGTARENEIPVFGPDGWMLDTATDRKVTLPPPYASNRYANLQQFFWSKNNGTDWHEANGIAKHADVTAMLAARDGTVYLGTRQAGILRTEGRLSTVSEEDSRPILTAPDHLTIFVSPNPIDDRALVRLYLERDSDVALELYDLLGRRVASIHDGSLDAGMTPFELNAADLPWGPYLFYARDEEGDRGVLRVWVE